RREKKNPESSPMPEGDTVLLAARALGRSLQGKRLTSFDSFRSASAALGLAAALLCGCRARTEQPASAPPAARAPAVEAADVARTPAPPGKFRRLIWIGLDG